MRTWLMIFLTAAALWGGTKATGKPTAGTTADSLDLTGVRIVDTLRLTDSLLVVEERDFLEELLRPDSLTGAKANIHADPKLEELLRVRRDVYKQGGYSFEGYRIQILSASSYSANVDTLRAYRERLEEEFPQYRAYLQYFDPDFKIRVGNFHSRIETLPALMKVREKYPRAYIVKSKITVRDLMPVVEQDSLASDSLLQHLSDSLLILPGAPAEEPALD